MNKFLLTKFPLLACIALISCSSGGSDPEIIDNDPPAEPKHHKSYSIGSSTNITTNALGGVCLMGGSTENDEAMKWFLNRANGGDVLVLRTSGSDGYNKYMYTSLGVKLNSVETIVCESKEASNDAYVQDKIKNAEAIWFAGGDQWDYISYWRDTPVAELLNKAIKDRNVVIGGTSAGMAIQGSYYFSAKNGTITSEEALNNPFDKNLTVESKSFIDNEYLKDVITDTHYDNPNRKGRHVTFLARILTDEGVKAKGIACDEYTAVCIDTDGIASVYGNYPDYDDNAYFIQVNPDIENAMPEECAANQVLNWNREGLAIKVYHVRGVSDGSNSFDLKDWETATGGEWKYWYVDNGNLSE